MGVSETILVEINYGKKINAYYNFSSKKNRLLSRKIYSKDNIKRNYISFSIQSDNTSNQDFYKPISF